jgi:hypothetical protein
VLCLPVLMLGILFGLAMDYEVLLVSRMREDFIAGHDAPAAMKLFGRAAWWLPRFLDRALPDLDIEGSKLDPEPAHPTPPAGGRLTHTAHTAGPAQHCTGQPLGFTEPGCRRMGI